MEGYVVSAVIIVVFARVIEGGRGRVQTRKRKLCPLAMEPEAHVKTMLAAEQMFDLQRVIEVFGEVRS